MITDITYEDYQDMITVVDEHVAAVMEVAKYINEIFKTVWEKYARFVSGNTHKRRGERDVGELKKKTQQTKPGL